MEAFYLILALVGVAVGSYLIGSVNCSILISKSMNKDVRESGSGNAGATNMLRTFGPTVGILTMLGDFLKTLIPLVITRLIFKEEPYWQSVVAFSGFFCSMGHAFPIYFGFRGGKAVTVVGMVFLVVDWRCFAVGITVFILTVAISKFVSLGSILAAFSGPITMAIVTENMANRWLVSGGLLALSIVVLILHRENVKRLIKGTERKFKFKKD